jgi:hypothetical protein
MRIAVFLLASVLMALSALASGPATAQDGEIELTELEPEDGAELDAPPEMVHLCFSEPVNYDENSTFNFTYEAPGGRNLGLRIVFQPSGECVDVLPGLQALGDEPPDGTYLFTWEVIAAEGDGEGSGEVQYFVGEGAALTPRPEDTPEGTETAEASPTPEDGATGGDSDDDEDQDILRIVVITIAGAIGVALMGLLLYALRRRLGYAPHSPAAGGEEDGGAPPGDQPPPSA